MKVCIFGGSFNPVHSEHIKIALSSIEELGLDKLIVMPTYVAPHKKGVNVISGFHRKKMLEIAFNGNDKVEVSDYELLKQGVSYTYQTIEHFKTLYKDSELYFLMGSDMLENFPTWKNPEIIIKNAKLVLTKRINGETNDNKSIEIVKNLYGVTPEILSVYGTTVSSTKIRVYKALGLSLEGLVPKQVEDYIDSNGIYLGNDLYSYVKNTLPIKRRVHTAGVILTAIKLAKTLGVSTEKAEIAGLLHDIAKYEDASSYPNLKLPKDISSDIIHQYLGEYIARKTLGVTDEAVLSAIKYHTTGRSDMSQLERIIYVADIIEPSRTFSGVEELRTAVEADFEKGFSICLKEIVEFLTKSGTEIYPLTLEALNFYRR